MLRLSKAKVIFLALIVCTFVTENVAIQCRSYGKQLGECVLITRCPRLLAILLSSDRTLQDLRMLQKLTCVTEISDLEKDPVVCCPLNEISDALTSNSNVPPSSNPTSTTTTTQSSIPVTTTTSTTRRPVVQHQKVELDNFKFQSLLPSLKECSISYVTDRIIGGINVSHGTYPWMARLGYRHKVTGRLEYYCGGSIISRRYILTAGHCTQGFDENFILSEVRLGEHDTTSDVDCNHELGNICSLPEDFKIERIITHPQHNTATKHNDIALIRLNKEISFGSYFVRPVCLPFLNQYGITIPQSFESVTNATVAGWGRQMWNKTQGSTQLMEVNIPLVNNKKCQQLYRRRVSITSKQMCAGGVPGKDSCSGDSGGPLMAFVPIPNQFSKPFQFGIVSFGQIQCGGPLPGVYTRVSEYLPWVLTNMEL